MTLQEAVDAYGSFDWKPYRPPREVPSDLPGETRWKDAEPAEAFLEVRSPVAQGIDVDVACNMTVECEGWTMTVCNVKYAEPPVPREELSKDWQPRVEKIVFKSGIVRDDGKPLHYPDDVSVEAWRQWKAVQPFKAPRVVAVNGKPYLPPQSV